MSRNLVIKQVFASVNPDDKRIIDTNPLVRKRMEEDAARRGMTAGDGFTAGLVAEEIEAAPGGDTQAGESGNVIKAGEEAAELMEQARREAEEITANAQAEAAHILEGARTEAEQEKDRILEAARQQGYADGQRKAEAEGQELRLEYAQKEKALEAAYEKQLEEMEPQLVDAITDIYEHIFQVELHSYREILSYLISNTLRRPEGGSEFIIHVSKEDYSYVNMQKKQLLAGSAAGNSNVDVVEDLTLSKNDCMIETTGGVFDCGLGTQLAELKQKLMLLAWSKEE